MWIYFPGDAVMTKNDIEASNPYLIDKLIRVNISFRKLQNAKAEIADFE